MVEPPRFALGRPALGDRMPGAEEGWLGVVLGLSFPENQCRGGAPKHLPDARKRSRPDPVDRRVELLRTPACGVRYDLRMGQRQHLGILDRGHRAPCHRDALRPRLHPVRVSPPHAHDNGASEQFVADDLPGDRYRRSSRRQQRLGTSRLQCSERSVSGCLGHHRLVGRDRSGTRLEPGSGQSRGPGGQRVRPHNA